jgi:hypothetical protein
MSITDAAGQRVAAARSAKEDWLAQAMATELTRADQDALLAAIPLLQRLLEH